MPVKSLESYLFERKLVNTSSIEILQNATIGIDVEHYLSRIYTYKKEQFLSAIGGIPSSLRDYIHSDLKVFKEFNIKPIFVIRGLDIQLQSTDFTANELNPNEQHLENSWTKLNSRAYNYNYNSNNNDSFRVFTDPLPLRPMINDLIKYFIEIGIDYLVCPYDASFQLSYLYHNKVIDSIYGSTDLLLTKVNKFILGMEFQSKDFRFIDKNKVLHELNLTSKQLVDLGIMVGCSLQPQTFPNLPPLPKPNPLQPYPQLSYFKLGLDILYQSVSYSGDSESDLYPYILSLNDQTCLDLYYKGRSAFKYIPVLNDQGYVSMYSVEMQKLGLINHDDPNDMDLFGVDSDPETPEPEKETEKTEKDTGEANGTKEEKPENIIQIPNDVHDIISQRLPPELYFYQSIGLAPVELLEAITQGRLSIRPPLESGLSDSYKKLINSQFYIDNLDKLLNLVTQLLARYYQVKKINVTYWYKPDVLELNNRLTPPVSRRINHLVYSNESVKNFDLIKFFQSLESSYPKDKTPEGLISNNNEIVSTVLLRSLYLFGIIDEKSDELTGYGKAIQKFAQEYESKVDNTQLQELILLLLLVKTNCLKLTDPNTEYSSVARNFKDIGNNNQEIKLGMEDTKHITLIARVLSIHKLNIAPINYQGPISRSLLNFRSHLKFISTNLSYTLQCCLLDMIVRQEHNNVKIDFDSKDDWYRLVDSLPFFKDINNTLLGVITEIYFEYSVKQSKLNGDLSKEQIMENSRNHLLNSVYQINNPTFNINVHGVNSISSNQLLADFKAGMEFWSLFVDFTKTVNLVDKNVISDEYYGAIKETDEWIDQFLERK